MCAISSLGPSVPVSRRLGASVALYPSSREFSRLCTCTLAFWLWFLSFWGRATLPRPALHLGLSLCCAEIVCVHPRNLIFLSWVFLEIHWFSCGHWVSPVHLMCTVGKSWKTSLCGCLLCIRCAKRLAFTLRPASLTLFYKQGQCHRGVEELTVTSRAGLSSDPPRLVLSTWKVFTCLYKISFESFWLHCILPVRVISPPLFLLNNPNTPQTSYLLMIICIY